MALGAAASYYCLGSGVCVCVCVCLGALKAYDSVGRLFYLTQTDRSTECAKYTENTTRNVNYNCLRSIPKPETGCKQTKYIHSLCSDANVSVFDASERAFVCRCLQPQANAIPVFASKTSTSSPKTSPSLSSLRQQSTPSSNAFSAFNFRSHVITQ